MGKVVYFLLTLEIFDLGKLHGNLNYIKGILSFIIEFSVVGHSLG